MILQLEFDADISYIFIPDGFISDLKLLEKSFLEWVQSQPSCIEKIANKYAGFSFAESDFLKYLNTTVLENCNKKAFMLSKVPQKVLGKLKF